MRTLAMLAALLLAAPFTAFAQGSNGGGECPGGLCGTPNQSGGGCGCGCGCGSILVAMTDRGDTYQFADDFDGDGIEDEYDNCPFMANYDQADTDTDLVGDSCDSCVALANPTQSNIDGDAFGDACDTDMDDDSFDNPLDNCPEMPNSGQVDTDGDTLGDACDADDDNDDIPDIEDGCRLQMGHTGDACDDDVDGDGLPGCETGDATCDNCPTIYNPELGTDGMQLDMNGDGQGDACDSDIDGDGIDNFGDNCAGVANPSQLDADFDGLGDAGNWSGGAESCDPHECYVIGGDATNCLDPESSFNIYLTLVGDRIDGKFQVDSDITVALFSNRLGPQHNWTATFTSLPSDSDVTLMNGRESGATALNNPQVTACLRMEGDVCAEMNNIRFTPDQPGTYTVKVTATLPHGDTIGPNTANYTIVAEVEGEPSGGCVAAGASGSLAMALGLLMLLRRRR